MRARKQRRVTPGRMAFLAACVPPVVFAVMGMAAFMQRGAADAGTDWTGIGLAAAMIVLVVLSLRAFSRGSRISAGVLLFAAYAPLVLALFLMIVVRFS